MNIIFQINQLKKLFAGLAILLLVANPVLAANTSSNVQRVQGAPDGTGSPVQVTIVDADGDDVAGQPVTGTVGIDQTTPGTTNGVALKQIGTTTVATGNGVVGTGVQRVAIASDQTAFTVNTAQATASNLNAQVVGNVASGAADSGNPVKVAGKYESTPLSLSTGQRADLQLDSGGALLTRLTIGSGNNGVNSSVNGGMSDGVSNIIAAYRLIMRPEVYNGSTWDRLPGNTNAISVLPGLSSTYWNYTNGATGILSNTTTAVTIKTAAGAGVRNFIDSCTINTTAFGAAVPLVIRDGAGGTILWAQTVPTVGWLSPVPITFQMPLRSTANTLLEIATPTANTSGTVWVSCQGHTGA